MEGNNISLESQGTTIENSNAEAVADNDSATAPQEQDTNAAAGAEGGTSTNDGGNEPPEPYLTIKYNHEQKGLTQEEAVTLAQKGMAYDSIYTPLQRAAALKGMTVKAFIESVEKAQDSAYREELIAKYGEDDMETVDSLMELYQSKKESTIKAAEEAEKQLEAESKSTLESRLADEFIELQKEFPDIKDFNSLPKSVKKAAADGEHLLFSYMRFMHSETRKAEAAQKSADAAKKASGGSMSDVSNGNQSTTDALMKGLYG